MLWLTWRQHRTQVLITYGLLALFAAGLLANGKPAQESWAISNMLPYVTLLVAVPAVIGVLWGAPMLANEVERGTAELVLVQSVSRWRWIGVKLGVLAPVVLIAGLVFGQLTWRWVNGFGMFGRIAAFQEPMLFPLVGVVPAGWWLFGFMTGAMLGAVIRKTLPAMALTIVVLGLVFGGLALARPHYAEPIRGEGNARSEPIVPEHAWVVSSWSTGNIDDGTDWSVADYHPADRYWRFQWTEAGILLAGAVVLGGVTISVAGRRR